MDKVASPAETPAEAVSPYRDPEPFQVTAQDQALCFFPSGSGRLERLLKLIEEAETSLKLAFYIYADDACGRKVRETLVAAARRGVKVSLIVDGFGAGIGEDFFAELEAAVARLRRPPARGRPYRYRSLADGHSLRDATSQPARIVELSLGGLRWAPLLGATLPAGSAK